MFLVRATRRQRQRRPVAGDLRVDDRGRHPARHAAPRGADRPERHRHRALRASRAPTTRSSSRARSSSSTFECRLDSQDANAWAELREPADLHRPRARPAHLRGARGRRRGQRRPDAGRLRLDGRRRRRRRRRRSTPAPPAVDARPRARSSSFSASEAGRPSSARSTAAPFAACTSPRAVHRPRRRPARVPRPRDRPRRPRRRRRPRATPGRSQPPPDTTAPETTIDSGPPAETASTSATLTFSAERAGATFAVLARRRLPSTTCTSPVHAHATCRSARTSCASARPTPPATSTRRRRVRNWTVTPPPETTILDRRRPTATESTTATFTFDRRTSRARPSSARSTRTLDVHAVRVAASRYTGLVARRARVPVRAGGAAGNVDPTPATYSWEIGDIDAAGRDDHRRARPSRRPTRPPTFTFRADDPDGRLPVLARRRRRSRSARRRRPTPRPSSRPPRRLRWPARTPSRSTALKPAPARRPGPGGLGVDDRRPRPRPRRRSSTGPDAEIALDTPRAVHLLEQRARRRASSARSTRRTAASEWSACAVAAGEHGRARRPRSPARTRCSVRAVDPSLNVDPTPATVHAGRSSARRSRRSSTGPPADPPRPRTTTRDLHVRGRPAPASTYICSLDGAELAPCTSPVTYTAAQLAAAPNGDARLGEHTFEVQATNRLPARRGPAARATTWIDRRPARRPRRRSTPARRRPRASTTATLHLLRPNEPDVDLRVLARRRAVRGLRLAARAHRPRARLAHARGPRDRRGRQRRRRRPPATRWTVVAPPPPNTPAGTDVDRRRSRSPVRRDRHLRRGHDARLHRRRRALDTAPALPDGLPDRRRHATTTSPRRPSTPAPVTVCLPYDAGVADAAGPPPAPRRHRVGRHHAEHRRGHRHRLRRGRQPVAVRDRRRHGARRARDDDRVRARRLDREPDRDLRVLLERPARDLRVRARRSAASWGSCDSPHLVEDLLPGQHELLVRAAQRARQRRRDARRVHRWTVTAPADDDRRPARRPRPSSTTATFTFSSNDPLADLRVLARRRVVQLLRDAAPAREPAARRPRAARPRAATRPAPSTRRRPATSGRSGRCPTRRSSTGRPTRPTAAPRRSRSSRTCRASPSSARSTRRSTRGSFAPCTSPVTYDNLIFGEHDFAVRAKDADGNVDPTPAEWSWDVEGLAPPVDDHVGPGPRRPRAGPRASRSPPPAATSSTSARSTAARSRSASRRRPTTACRSARTRSRSACSCPTRRPSRRRRPTSGRSSRPTPPETTIVFGPGRPELRPTIRRAAARSRRSPSRATSRPRPSSARSTAQPFTACPDPAAVHRPDAPARTSSASAPSTCRCNVDPTPASWRWTVVLDTTRAGHDDQHRSRPTAIEGQSRDDRHLHRQRAGRDVRVLARQRAVRAVRVADRVQRPDAGRAPLPRPRDRPGRQHRAAAASTRHVHDRDRTRRRPRRRSSPARPRPCRTTGRASRSPPTSPTRRSSARSTAEPFEECFNPTQYVELEPGAAHLPGARGRLGLNPDPTPGDAGRGRTSRRTRRPRRRSSPTPPNPSHEHHRRLPVPVGRARRSSSSARSTPSRSSPASRRT